MTFEELAGRLTDRTTELEAALRVADEHLTTLYPTGVKDGDFVCKTVREALNKGFAYTVDK